jgi:predicted ATPase
MCKIKIKNFGPIKEGFDGNDGWMDIKKVTVLIGNQGSGKSTVAKLFATMSWMEKALMRNVLTESDLRDPHKLMDIFSYQGIGNYFRENSLVAYQGAALSLEFIYSTSSPRVEVRFDRTAVYALPKIMYIPSDRNFTTVVPNIAALKGLPSPLYTFSDEFIKAGHDLDGDLALPIGNARFRFNKLVNVPYLVGEDYVLKLSEASSGFQSFVPLFVVTQFLAKVVAGKLDHERSQRSLDEEARIRKEVEAILRNPALSEDLKRASLELLSRQNVYAALLNIVEEPEQNLFPPSQKRILWSLLEYAHQAEASKLVVATHSPYMINFLSLAVQADGLSKKVALHHGDPELNTRIAAIVPLHSQVNPEQLAIYQLDEQGGIGLLPDYEGIPSDDHALNLSLMEGNDLFGELLEIEQELLNLHR